MNEVRVVLFARARELAGAEALTVATPGAATVADLRRLLAERCPALEALLPRCAIGINGEYAVDSAAVPPGAEVAVLPPVSGG